MPPSSTTGGNTRVPSESRSTRRDLLTAGNIGANRHLVTDTSHPTTRHLIADTRMCQITAVPSTNNMNCDDNNCAECYSDMTHHRPDNGETMTLYSDNYDAPSRTFCLPESHTFTSLYPATPVYYDTPPPSEAPLYYTSTTPPPSEVPVYYTATTPPQSEIAAYYAPTTSTPPDAPANYTARASSPSEAPVYYTSRTSSTSEVPVYYRTTTTSPHIDTNPSNINSPPPSSSPPLLRTTRTPLQPPTQIDIPAPEWHEASPCYHFPSPPPAHIQTLQSPRSLLWRVDFEQEANLQIWDERTQDLLSISFQSIVEALAENKRKEAITDAFIEQQHQIQQSQPDHEIATEQTNIMADKDLNVFHNAQNNVNNASKNISDVKSKKIENQNDEGIATFIKSIDDVIADAEIGVKNDNWEAVTKLEMKEEDECMEQDDATQRTKNKVKMSNSERCRLFREKRMRKMKTNEEILKQLEKRNKILKETERMLIESKERSQKNCLKVIRGTL